MNQEIRLSLLLKMVNNSFERELNNRICDLELTSSQSDVLGYIHRNSHSELNPMDIEIEFRLKRPTVTGILKRLNEKGFIEFAPSCKDNRYKRILLTEKSQKLHERMLENVDIMEQVLYRNVSKKDQLELSRILKIMLENMTD